jgi:hypothetical protein
MWGWVSRRPQHCLKFGADSLAWAESERDWRGRSRHRCLASPLPEGVVKLSPIDKNLSDLSTVQSRIRSLTGSGSEAKHAKESSGAAISLPRRIAVLLPDAAVRAVVLQLDQLPSKQDERDALIRWRLGQEQLFSLSGARVVSQVFPHLSEGEHRTHTVLALSVEESVLNQYEELCESVGLIPQEVRITSLSLFDLWRRASGGSSWKRRDFLWANVTDHALTTMVFQRGRLLFYRCKLLGRDAAEVCAKTEMLDKILEECGASLDACLEQHPSAAIKEAVICGDGDLSAWQTQIETNFDLSVESLSWRSMETLGWATKGSHQNMTSLAAMAGVV